MGEYLLGFFSSWMERGTTDRSWRHIRTKIGISTQLSQYCERLNPALDGLALFALSVGGHKTTSLARFRTLYSSQHALTYPDKTKDKKDKTAAS
jgi:hypothetical protein